jgi:hypothetical protein
MQPEIHTLEPVSKPEINYIDNRDKTIERVKENYERIKKDIMSGK